MPLFSYKCDNEKCDAVAVEILSKKPPKWARCIKCGHPMTRQYGACQMRYGKNMHTKPCGKDQFVMGLGEHISDPFEYAKKMDKAGLRRTSIKEMEQIQADVRRDTAGEIKKARKRAEKKQLEFLRKS